MTNNKMNMRYFTSTKPLYYLFAYRSTNWFNNLKGEIVGRNQCSRVFFRLTEHISFVIG